MKTHRTFGMLLAGLLLGLSVWPMQASAQQRGEQPADGYLGRWYVQTFSTEVFDPEQAFYFEFNGQGGGVCSNRGDQMQMVVEHVPREASLRLREVGHAEAHTRTVRYDFEVQTLVLYFGDTSRGEERQRMELTRDPAGTERHQQMRERGAYIPPTESAPGPDAEPQAQAEDEPEDEAETEPEPVPALLEDWFFGEWHIQCNGADVIATDRAYYFDFNSNREAVLWDGDVRTTLRLGHDPERAVFSFEEFGSEAAPRAYAFYRFEDQVLVFYITYDPEVSGLTPDSLGVTERLELTRSPRGTARHHAMREAGRFIPPPDNPDPTPPSDLTTARPDPTAIHGTWHLQLIGDRAVSNREDGRLMSFGPDGVLRALNPQEVPAEFRTSRYRNDLSESLITIYNVDDPDNHVVAGYMRYQIEGDLLRVRMSGPNPAQWQYAEFTRGINGNARHREMREAQEAEQALQQSE